MSEIMDILEAEIGGCSPNVMVFSELYIGCINRGMSIMNFAKVSSPQGMYFVQNLRIGRLATGRWPMMR
jgi:hypothetical protein